MITNTLPEAQDHTQTTSTTSSGEAGIIDENTLLQRIPVSRRTIHVWRQKGILPHIKIAKRVLYHWPTVEASLLRRQQA